MRAREFLFVPDGCWREVPVPLNPADQAGRPDSIIERCSTNWADCIRLPSLPAIVIALVQLGRISGRAWKRRRLGGGKRARGRTTRQATLLGAGIAVATASADPGLERAFDLFRTQGQNGRTELPGTSLAGDRFAQGLRGKKRNEIEREVTRYPQMRVSRIPAAFGQ